LTDESTATTEPFLTSVLNPRHTPPPSLPAIFLTFTQMGLLGFGGVLPWARRLLVDQRGWLDDLTFAELLSLGQILPGPNICNLSVIFGYRQHQLRGALAALGGLVTLPFMLVVSLALVYDHYADIPQVAAALHGMMATAAGLVLASGLKLASAQSRSWRGLMLGIAAFVLIGGLRWPLIPVMAGLIVIALTLKWQRPAHV